MVMRLLILTVEGSYLIEPCWQEAAKILLYHFHLVLFCYFFLLEEIKPFSISHLKVH